MNPYDVDVLVIGAGPAGLAAATRARWVKGYHAVPSSVLVVEPGEPGGLLRWGSCVLTGPGWAYNGEELTRILMSDIERLAIPIVRDRAVRIDRDGRVFRVTFAMGAPVRCLSIVLACGFRAIGNETALYQSGVRITFKGYDHFPSLVRTCAKEAAGRGLVVVGNAKTANLAAILAPPNTDGAGDVTWLVHDELIAVVGEQCVTGVRVRDGAGERVLPCGSVLMDYNAFELLPSFDVSVPSLRLDARGFVWVDAWLRTSCPGIFAAGDITGRWASTLVALGDGVTAGFGAYSTAFHAKFGRAPRLFAYAATDEVMPAQPRDLPTWHPDAVPIAVGPNAPSWIDGQSSLAALASAHGRELQALCAELDQAACDKSVTVHHLWQPT